MMTVRGHFAEVSVTGDVFPDEPEKSNILVTINTASIRTHNEQRDNDLRSSNFLEAEKYPTITFQSTGVETAGGDRYRLTGDLTIKDVTKPATLDVVKYGEFNDPNMMGHRIGYAAETTINRKDFGMRFEMLLDGKFVVSNDVKINIEGELVEAKEEAPASAG
jgi:polyisoprenoid-binding protein YceI